ncbi:DUF2000 domain-containing protein, partial [Kitasatospora nipponensis]|uniref:DUF2000 domain-containing protein n=1 Tax=Kitasatospora nipponensis TaxID=258049 RepID=UPI0031CE3501
MSEERSERAADGDGDAYDYRARKITAVLASDLAPGVALNVLGHLSVALGAHADDTLMGRPLLLDGSGGRHLGIARYPVVVTRAKRARIRRLVDEAKQQPDLLCCDYPEQMLTTGHDVELAAALAAGGGGGGRC